MPDEDDRPRDASNAADASWPDLVVPDDISALAADISAYHRELRAARRRERFQQFLAHRAGVPLIMVTVAIVVAAIVAGLLTSATGGNVEPSQTALPLAHTDVQAGQPDGALPSVMLSGAYGQVNAQMLRPAVVTLIRPNCDCTPLINSLAGAAGTESLPLDIVVAASSDSYAANLPSQLHRGNVNVYYDPYGALAAVVGAQGTTVVVVNRHGLIYDVFPSVTTASATSISAPLQSMRIASGTSA